jgi:hypothetical protein
MMTDEQIGRWIVNRRVDKRKGELPPWKEHRISSIAGWMWKFDGFRNKEELVRLAESIAERNAGTLPPVIHIQGSHPKLYSALRKKPDWFSHIPRVRPYTPLGEKVDLANRLAKEHGGILPNQGYLRKHYPALLHHMKLNPGPFSDIPRERRFVIDIKDAVLEAEGLARSEGFLPNNKWLRDHRPRIAEAQRKEPQRFSHIPQMVRGAGGGSGAERVTGFRNGTETQRRTLEIKFGLRPAPRRAA